MNGFFSDKKTSIVAVVLMFTLAACAGVNTAPQRMSVQDYYQRGLEQLAQGDTGAALQLLDEMNTLYPFHTETGELYVRLVKGYYDAGQADAAIGLADRFVKMYPTHKDVAYVHYLAAMADYDRGRRNISMDVITSDPTYAKAALARFQTLLACCGKTEHAFNAKQYIYHLESMISLYELRFMEWDYDAGRIDAAAQRGVSLLVSYPDSVAAKRARMMLESDNFRAHRAEINRAIRESHPAMPVAEMAPAEEAEPEARFIIHVASAATLSELDEAVAQIGLAGEVDYYRRFEADKTYYVAAFGRYPDRDAAKADRLRLRVRTEVPGLWVRALENSERVEDIDEIKKAEARARADRARAGLTAPAATPIIAAELPDVQPAPAPAPTVADSFYAVQMMSYTELAQLKKVISALPVAADVNLYSHVVKGTTYYIALYGNYPDWTAGKVGLAELERRTGKTGYWLRKVDGQKVKSVR